MKDTLDLARLEAIDFHEDIARLTQGFVGREWVFGEVDAWLERQDERLFLLTGEPGVGKSAIAARLTQTRQERILAHHFCIAGRNNTVVPQAVLRSLAAQMGATLPEYGPALANTIKPAQLRVDVKINVERLTGGQITGVLIENLKPTDPETEIDILLRAPLAELSPPAESRFILVDSLDEAMAHRGEVNLVTLLAQTEGLPDWVRFLCTSRPEGTVLSYFVSLEPYTLDAESADNLADVENYIEKRVKVNTLQACLKAASVECQHLGARIAELARGNFLYAQMLLDDIEAGHQPLDDLDALPQSLDEIYHRFLRRFAPREWRQRYRPLLSVLAVVRQPIAEIHLVRFTGLPRSQVRDNLEVIAQFLSENLNAQGHRTYILFHQSFRDYLHEGERNRHFWCPPEEGHRKIVDAYFGEYHGRWTRASDDGYLFDNLAYHLDVLAGGDHTAADDLRRLFDNQEWMNARVPQSGYRYEGYIADLMRAWRRANRMALEQIEVDEEPTSLAECVRYALIRTSITSLATNYSPGFVERAVELGLWTTERAFGVAGRVPIGLIRAFIWARVIRSGNLSDTERERRLQQGLTQALELSHDMDKGPSLGALAPLLTGEMLHNAFSAACAIEEEGARHPLLVALLPHLPEDLAEQGLELVLAIDDDYFRAEALAALAPNLTGELLQQGIEAALAMGDERLMLHILTPLAPRLAPESRQRALTAAINLDDASAGTQALVALAPVLEGKDRERALAAGLEAVQAEVDPIARAEALVALAPHLPGEDGEQMLRQEFENALAIDNEWFRAATLAALAPQLAAEAHKRAVESALEAALTLTGGAEHYQATVLETLAPHLSGELLQRGLLAALALEPSPDRTRALDALAPQLTSEPVQQALAAAQAIDDEGYQMAALAALASELTEEQHELVVRQASIAARALRDEWSLDLTGEDREQAIQKEIEAALAGITARDRVRALGALVPYLAGDDRDRVLHEMRAAVQSAWDKADEAQALAALAPHLAGKAHRQVVQRALSAALAAGDDSQDPIFSEWKLGDALAAVARHATGEMADQVLRAGLAIGDERHRAGVLAALAPQLTGELLGECLAGALAISDEESRAKVLAALAPQLPGEMQAQALEAALAIGDEGSRARALIAFLPVSPDPAPLVRNLRQAISANLLGPLSIERRDEVLVFCAEPNSFAPPILDQATLAAIANHIVEVCQEWQWM